MSLFCEAKNYDGKYKGIISSFKFAGADKQSRVLFTISIIVWCVMGGLSRRRDGDTCGGCHGHGSHVISLQLSQTSHMISLRRSPGPVNPSSDDTGGDNVTSHNPCKYCHSSEQSGNNERVHQQLNILASLNICFQSSKIWKLIEKENRFHDVTVLIKGSLE